MGRVVSLSPGSQDVLYHRRRCPRGSCPRPDPVWHRGSPFAADMEVHQLGGLRAAEHVGRAGLGVSQHSYGRRDHVVQEREQDEHGPVSRRRHLCEELRR